MRFIDSNVFLGYLVHDDRDKRKDSYDLLQKITRGEIEVMTSAVVIHELCYVLSSSRHYKLDHTTIKEMLHPLLDVKGLRIHDKAICLDALNVFAEREYLDYSDALAIAYVRANVCDGIISYDKGLDNLADSKRVEPKEALG